MNAYDALHYLAYGSNLHPYRLMQRVPNARFITSTRLDGHRVSFSKRSHDGSGKCNLLKTGRANSTAHVAIYAVPITEKHLLDNAEGLGKGYKLANCRVTVADEAFDVFTYVAASTHVTRELLPYDWYKSMVVEGARYHGFPADYVSDLELQPSNPDPDVRRRLEAEAIVVQMRKQKRRSIRSAFVR